MGKIVKTLGAVIGFLGLATLAVFAMELTGSNHYAPTSKNSLLADVAANDPLQDASATPGDQPSDASAVIDPGVDASSTVIADSSSVAVDTEPSSTETDASSSPTAPSESPQPEILPDAASTTQPTVPVIAPPPPAPVFDVVVDTSTVATPTITVTPTAPPFFRTSPVTVSSPVTSGDLALPYDESNFQGSTQWQTTWGDVNTTWSNALDLSASTDSTGGAVYLKNAAHWSNYTMTASLDWVRGQDVALMANYVDASNYVTCAYSKNASDTIAMQLIQYVAGNEIFLSPNTPVSWNGDGANLELSIKVKGTYGTCSFNGQTVSNDTIGPSRSPMSNPGTGSVGFAINDFNAHTSEITIQHVHVETE